MSFLRDLIRFLTYLLMPLILILVGAGIAGGGFSLGWNWAVIAGLVVAAAGVVWGVFLFLVHSPFEVD